MRVDASPVVSARQNGELADSPSSTGMCTRIPLADVDRLVRIVDGDMHVHPEDQLLAGDEPQRGDQIPVARPRDDPLVLPHRERMGAGRADRQPLGGRRPRDLAAQRAQLLAGLRGVLARIGRDLQHRLHQLRLDLADGRRARSIASIALTSSSESASRIISSSSMPIVNAGPVNACSTAAEAR